MRYLLLLSLVVSCQTKVVQFSKRDLMGRSPVPEIYKKGRKVQGNVAKPPQIFMRKKKVKIEPLAEQDNNGSLLSLSNPENYLFYDKPKGQVGDVLPVFVRVNQKEKADAGGGAQGEQEAAALKDELLAALPQFTPGEGGEDTLPLTMIKFKVDRRLPNGDVIVSTYRTSKNENHSSSVRVQARIERYSLMTKKEITTKDLLDVEWYQRKDGEVVERESLAWQDEYTLRLSGFDEARSKFAQQLENKRQDMSKVKDRLKTRINVLSKERQMFVKSRQKLDEEKRKVAQVLKENNEKMESQNTTIEEQKAIIKRQQELLEGLQEGAEQNAAEGGANEN